MSKDLICDAIGKRTEISFVYSGSLRTAEPHILGYDRAGELTLSAWQMTGGTGTGWRDFHVRKLSSITSTGMYFSDPRPGYNPNDTTLSQIICRL